MRLLGWLLGGRESGRAGREPDGFVLALDHPLGEEHRLLSAAMREVEALGVRRREPLATVPSGQRILALDPERQRRVVLAAAERYASAYRRRHEGRDVFVRIWHAHELSRDVVKALLRRPLPLDADDLASLVETACSVPEGYALDRFSLPALLGQVERLGAGDVLPAQLRGALRELAERLASDAYATAERRRLGARVDRLLSGGPPFALERREPWADAVHVELDAMPPETRRAWIALCGHLAAGSATSPSGRWMKEARRLRDAVGAREVEERALAWVGQVTDGAEPVSTHNGDVLRGLVWLLGDASVPEVPGALGDLAIAMARKIPDVGLRSQKVLNACIVTLGAMAGMEPLAQLTRLRAKVKAVRPQALVARTLEEAARRQGMPLADLEELVTPNFGMEEVGCLRREIGGWVAEVRIVGTDSVERAWRAADGNGQRSVPADVKRDHAEELAELERAMREMTKMLPAQRDRLERLLVSDRALPLAQWRERYLDHPFVGPLARRLIWHFADDGGGRLGAWLDDGLVDVEDRPLHDLAPDTPVRLWHPLGFPVDTVRAWRAWLERHERSQPFKQAHREIYLITDAELRTETYSNRFAAHIVRQHQFAALCRARGWHYQLQGAFDSHDTPELSLPRWGLRAEFWVEPCLGDDGGLSPSGIALHASTDQVRFLNDAGEPVPLAEVPVLAFSEVMRDVDLFVGVASVANDPTWVDQGQRPEWGEYWRSYSFGDLSASAQTRREVLARLLPRLKIGARCTIDGRYLVVRGDLRTYKIHLGSGNVLMEPNDQYLCIVQDRGGTTGKGGAVWLPFEGDGMMSIILSKAVLLAADTRIADPTIVRQIRRS